MAASSFSEPSCRWSHHSAAVKGQLYVFGGITKDFSKGKTELAVSVQIFNQCMKTWQTKATTGNPPLGLCDGACTSSGHHLYLYGGWDGSLRHDSLHQLDTNTLEWSQLPSGPTRKDGCDMVCFEGKLVLFGGYGFPLGPRQPEAEFIKDSALNDGSGWTNELHCFEGGEMRHKTELVTAFSGVGRCFGMGAP